MNQTLLIVTIAVQPNSVELLEARIVEFRKTQETEGAKNYGDLKQAVPMLHFMALMVFRDSHYDPLFLLEVNFDGPELAFWRALDKAAGRDLVEMLCFCAMTHDDEQANQFKRVCKTGQGLPELMQELSIWPTASHLGNRGLTRERIEAEARLYDEVQAVLGDGVAFRTATAPKVHSDLRARVVPRNEWLNQPAATRISAAERRADWFNLILFLSLALAVLAVPGTVLALVLPFWFAALMGVVAVFLVQSRLPDLQDLVHTLTLAKLGIGLAALLLAVPWLMLGAFVLWGLAGLAFMLQGTAPVGIAPWLAGAFWMTLAGVAWVPALAFGLLGWLRIIERRDSTQFAPARDAARLSSMTEREDHTASRVYQNHMGSVTIVKPGVLRSLLLPLGHRALHLILRVQARDGYLSTMRTIHFAHWALLNNRSRLVFLSNFDGTWDSYLDDFIEKAHGGTTLAWTNCVGSPLARFLMLDGVKKGRQFKAWARQSMAPNLFWFSAYPKLTVNQIERNHAIAEGLRKPVLQEAEATQWTRVL